MFDKGQKLFYIDRHDGLIQEGKFLEETDDGIWIKLKGQSINTFVYSNLIDSVIFQDPSHARDGLERFKNRLKSRLTAENTFIKDILERLEKTEGKLYLSVIKEILHDKMKI